MRELLFQSAIRAGKSMQMTEMTMGPIRADEFKNVIERSKNVTTSRPVSPGDLPSAEVNPRIVNLVNWLIRDAWDEDDAEARVSLDQLEDAVGEVDSEWRYDPERLRRLMRAYRRAGWQVEFADSRVTGCRDYISFKASWA